MVGNQTRPVSTGVEAPLSGGDLGGHGAGLGAEEGGDLKTGDRATRSHVMREESPIEGT